MEQTVTTHRSYGSLKWQTLPETPALTMELKPLSKHPHSPSNRRPSLTYPSSLPSIHHVRRWGHSSKVCSPTNSASFPCQPPFSSTHAACTQAWSTFASELMVRHAYNVAVMGARMSCSQIHNCSLTNALIEYIQGNDPETGCPPISAWGTNHLWAPSYHHPILCYISHQSTWVDALFHCFVFVCFTPQLIISILI